MHYDVVIIGGGAAGLFCASEAGQRGLKTLVIEHNTQLGRKILISGGGRCNFTNLHTQPENFVSRNPHFSKSALAQYTPEHFVSLIRKHRIEFYEKKLGQLFCRDSSRQIVEMLIKECRTAKADIRTGCRVTRVSKDGSFHVDTSQGNFTSEKLVIAAGGLSFRKIGATDFGYRIARQFGLKIVETRPSLVALAFDGTHNYSNLAGLSVDAEVKTSTIGFRENILFTHRGLSGPAILQISNYWERGKPVSINLVPNVEITREIGTSGETRKNLGNLLGRYLPVRLIDHHLPEKLRAKPAGQLSGNDIAEVNQLLSEWQVTFKETEGYHRAEVTLGGVSTAELSSQTMESKKVPGLYFIGEVVDVTGWLGGYNFQWAWASAAAAGRSL